MKQIEFLDKELKCLGHVSYIEATYVVLPIDATKIYIIPDGQKGYCNKE